MSDQNPPSSNSTGFDFSNIDFGKQDPNKGIEFDFSNIEFGGSGCKKKRPERGFRIPYTNWYFGFYRL